MIGSKSWCWALAVVSCLPVLPFRSSLLAQNAPGGTAQTASVEAPQPAGTEAIQQPQPAPVAPRPGEPAGRNAAAQAPPLSDFPGAGLVNSHPPFLTGAIVDRADGTYREGDTLAVQFRAEQEARLYVLYHEANGQTLLLFPNLARRDNLIPAKVPVVIPGKEEKFKFRIQAPFGEEVFQVIASLKPLGELEALITEEPHAPTVSGGVIEKLKARLLRDPSSWTEHRVRLRTTDKTAPPAPRPLAARAGLFVGIGEYQHPELAESHAELRHSAEVLHELMLQEGKLDRERTRLVVDQEATRANLEMLMTHWLPSVSKPGDTVFVYFSGHVRPLASADPLPTAATVVPRDGEPGSAASHSGEPAKPASKKPALLPWDFDMGASSLSQAERQQRERESSISDSALLRWLGELSGRKLVLILDTCHQSTPVGSAASSAADPSVAAGPPVAVRSAPIAGPLAKEAARVNEMTQIEIVMLGSFASAEPALFEGAPGGTMWFTSLLAEGIGNAKRPRPLSVAEAHHFAVTEIEKRLDDKHPLRRQLPGIAEKTRTPILMAP